MSREAVKILASLLKITGQGLLVAAIYREIGLNPALFLAGVILLAKGGWLMIDVEAIEERRKRELLEGKDAYMRVSK